MKTMVVLLVSIIFLFLLRSIWTIPIETGGDAVRKFYAAAELVRTGDWSILLQDHHTLRWAIVLPQTFLTWITGPRYEVYYILPLLSFSLTFVIAMYAMRKHLDTSQMILLGALLFADPMSFRNASQLMTAGPGISYAIAACFVLASGPRVKRTHVILAAGLFFCAYGSHATYVSFAAGGILWLVFARHAWPSALLLAGVLLGLFAAECLYFDWLSGWTLTLGRVEFLYFGPHLEQLVKHTETFTRLFTRWLELPVLDVALSVIFFIAGLVYIALKNKPPIPGFVSCVYLVGLCFALFNSFAVTQLDPLNPVQLLLPRYLAPFLPFAAIISVYFLALITRSHGNYWNAGMLLTAALLLFTVFAMPGIYDNPSYPKVHIRPAGFAWKADREYSRFATQIYRGDLVYRRHKTFVVNMIVGFKYPGTDVTGDTTRPTNGLQCVHRLTRIPSRQNQRPCQVDQQK